MWQRRSTAEKEVPSGVDRVTVLHESVTVSYEGRMCLVCVVWAFTLSSATLNSVEMLLLVLLTLLCLLYTVGVVLAQRWACSSR